MLFGAKADQPGDKNTVNNGKHNRKRDFIGGSEQLRREKRKAARKRRRKEKVKNIPHWQVFMHALLGSNGDWDEIGTISGLRLGEALNDNVGALYGSRAALVLEEARHILSIEIERARKDRCCYFSVSNASLKDDQWTEIVLEGTVPPVLHKSLRFASVVLIDQSVLAFVSSLKDENKSHVVSSTIQLHSLETIPKYVHTVQLTPVVSLISYVRQFTACKSAVRVPFIIDLTMERNEGTHTRFTDSGDSDSVESAPEDMVRSENTSSECEALAKLNDAQRIAAMEFLDSPKATVSLVQGPPGTGKTTFLSSVIHQNVLSGRRILVTAPTNKALIVLCEKYIKLKEDQSCSAAIAVIGVYDKLFPSETSLACRSRSYFVYTWIDDRTKDAKRLLYTWSRKDKLPLLRLRSSLLNGIPTTLQRAGLLRHVKKIDSEDRYAALAALVDGLAGIDSAAVVQELLRRAQLIFCTLSTAGCTAMKATKKVDDLLVDEAGAAVEPDVYIAFYLRPSRVMLVGDPKQLPPLVTSPKAKHFGFEKSLLERLMIDEGKSFSLLNVQYRMRPEISAFASERFYDSAVRDGDNVQLSQYTSGCVIGRLPFVFVDVVGQEERDSTGSYYNCAESQAIVLIVRRMLELAGGDHNKVSNSATLRVITFYQGQLETIQQELYNANLGNVTVATVDSSQGCEADVVIVSFVRSQQLSASEASKAGFLSDDRRINVALTRARHQLICVGNEKTLSVSRSPTIVELLKHARDRNLLTTVDALVS